MKLPLYFYYQKLFKLLIITIKFNPDYVLCSGKHATWFGAVIKLFIKKKLIAFGHGTEFGTKNKKEIKINNITYSYLNLLISVSDYTLNYIKKNTNIVPKKTTVIHNGADDNLLKIISKKEISGFVKKNSLENKRILLT